MFITDKLFDIKQYQSNKEIDLYQKHMAQIWLYERWAKRANNQIPNLASRIFALRNKNYVGCVFHYSIERSLGTILVKLNNYDDCPPTNLYMMQHRIVMKVSLNQLFEDVVNAENTINCIIK